MMPTVRRRGEAIAGALVFAALVAAACHPPPRAIEPPVVAPAVARIDDAGSDAALALVAPPAAASDAGSDAGAIAETKLVDGPTWAAAHGLPARVGDVITNDGCSAVTVGAPARDALLCGEGGPSWGLPSGESEFSERILDASHGHLRTLLTVRVGGGPLDMDLSDEGTFDDQVAEQMYIKLDSRLSDDGLVFTVAESAEPGRGCLDKKTKFAGDRVPLQIIDRVCAGIGEYRWKNGHFVRR